ncbi:MAG: hypothetical protein JSS53_08530, partial [Proteobacteria bacterium]|nr:hypothetical protein [Pseudomonadota bacterium]
MHQEKPSLEDGKILCTILQPSQGLRERLLHFIETSENEACEKARDIFDLLFLDEIIEIVEIKFCAAGLAGNKNIDELRLILEKLMAGEMPARLVGKHKIQVSDKMIQALKVPLWNFCMTRILNPTPAHIAVMNLSRDFLITFFGLSEIKKLYQGELAKIENLHKEELAKLQAQYENPIVEIQMPYEEALKKLNIKFVKLKEQYESSSAKWYLFLGMSDLLYRYTHATTQSRNISITQASDALGFSVFGKNIHSEETKEHFQTSAEVEKEQGEMLGELEKAFRLDYMMFYLKTQITSKNPTFEKWLDDSINRMLDKRNLLVALEKRNFSISPVELVSALNAHGDAEFKSRYAKCNAADLNFKNDMEVKLILFYWVLDLVSGAQKENNALIMGLDFFTRMVNLYLSENRMARAEVLFLNLSSLFKLVGSNLLSSDSNIFRSALDDINSLIEAKKEKLIGAQSLAMKKIDLLLNQEKLNEALVALFNLRYNLNFSVTDPNHKEYQDRADGLMRLMLDDLLKANKVTEALQILVNGHEFNFEDTTIKCMPSHALMVSYRKEIKCSNFEDKILLGQLTKNIGDGGEAKNYFLGLLKDELSRGEFSNAIKVIRNARLIKGFSVSDHQRFDKLFFLAYINSSCSRVKAKKTDPIEINQYIDMILKIRTTGVLMFEGVRLVIRRKKGQADDESPWELVEAIVHLKNALLEANPIYYLEKTEIEVGKKSVPEKILTYSAALNQFLNRKNLQKNDYVHAVNFLNKMAGLLQDFKNSPKAKSSVIAHLGNSLNHMSSRVVVSYIEFLLKDSTS